MHANAASFYFESISFKLQNCTLNRTLRLAIDTLHTTLDTKDTFFYHANSKCEIVHAKSFLVCIAIMAPT